ncbi:putative bifunctional diguanylate cyclase/phosphodiesterase [Sedimenticola selenatireducens]|uniref:cyclic-guanylate-specific phosphodiesterase n=1 Tax=Sedimenticola selenatireducens TaxID=191960 RepID=A0A557S0U1_9GAMM|nr:EAL domain-containing protein [Sedimenticola selenatireducens]TVO70968.1 EAL domain-containing protein [Sedimenticola selenatireducens]TVT65834.1 MAG: EAL domain-containing protein [Sedimenticola selenatireducens]
MLYRFLKKRTNDSYRIITATIVLMALALLFFAIQSTWRAWDDFYASAARAEASQAVVQLMDASNIRAKERGYTLALLSGPVAPSDIGQKLEHIYALRQQGDIKFDRAVLLASQLVKKFPENFILRMGLQHVEEVSELKRSARERADKRILGEGGSFPPGEWFDSLTETINHEQHFRNFLSTAMIEAPVKNGAYWTIRNWVWLLSEYAGRERALLARHILTQAPLTESSRYELNQFHSVVEEHIGHIRRIRHEAGIDKRLLDAIEQMDKAISGEYAVARQELYANSLTASYTITGDQWLAIATQAIDSILNVSQVCSLIIEENVAQEKHFKSAMVILFSLMIIVFVFMVKGAISRVTETTRALIEEKKKAELSANKLEEEIAERNVLEKNLLNAQQNFLSLVMLNPTGMIILDTNDRCLFSNPAAQVMLDLEEDGVVTNKRLTSVPYSGRTELDVHCEANLWGIAEAHITETSWNGYPSKLILLHDITTRKTVENEIKHMAYHDGLTGLANRTLFKDRLDQAIKRAKRKETLIVILFIDIDKFKVINDSLGHAVGDELLCKVSGKLLCCVRTDDTVGRMGGDEFTVLIEDVTSPQDADVIVEKIQRELTTTYVINGHVIHLSVSIGTCIFPQDATDTDRLIQLADTAMFHAKESGRGEVRAFRPEMGERFNRRLRLESRLHRAADKKEFFVYYQPQVDLVTKRIIGAEALLRWEDQEFGMISPVEFIPVLEDIGLISNVGKWVLEEVCTQNKLWQERNLTPIPISVNLSPLQIVLQTLEEDVYSVLQKTGLESKYLELEITETALMKSPEACALILQQLVAMGVRISIDDFGTGYSSLSYLKKLPITKLKVDRSFVMEIPDNISDMSITTAIIGLGQSLNLDVIAEGVETLEQINFLRERGCREVQGFYFSQPLPVHQFEELLRAQSVMHVEGNQRFALL